MKNRGLQKNGKELRLIHEESDAREELRVSNLTLHSLIEASPQAIILLDLNRRIRIWNRAAEQMFGWTAEEVIGKGLPYIPEDKGEEHQKIFDRTFAGETITNLEIHRHRRDGSAVDLVLSLVPLRDARGKVTSCLAVAADISEQKKLQNQLFRAQRLESIGMLASGIAHDLNNILAPILMSIQIFKDRFKDESSQAALATLESSAKRGASLVKQVLTFARGYQGERMRIQIQHVLHDIEKIVAQTFPKSIRLTTDIPRRLPSLLADPTQLHQVLMNLCVNSRDAMPDGGVLSIRVQNITVDENYASMNIQARTGPYVVIEVSDTGAGIPPEIIDEIFEPFFTTKHSGIGTGLGLSTVQAIIKSHGGFVTVYSEVGKGTSFRAYLHALPASAGSEQESRRRDLPVGNDELILVVDDEAAVRDICKLTLESFGYRVVLAANGAEGLSTFARHTNDIAVVISDMSMPIMNGATMMEAMRAINPEVRILSSSGLAHYEGNTKNGPYAGVAGFLSKPYTAEELLLKIAELLKGNGQKSHSD